MQEKMAPSSNSQVLFNFLKRSHAKIKYLKIDCFSLDKTNETLKVCGKKHMSFVTFLCKKINENVVIAK